MEEQLLNLIRKIISIKIPFFTNIELLDKKVIFNRDQWYHIEISRLIFPSGSLVIETIYEEDRILIEVNDDDNNKRKILTFDVNDLDIDLLSFNLIYGRELTKICSVLDNIIPVSIIDLIKEIK